MVENFSSPVHPTKATASLPESSWGSDWHTEVVAAERQLERSDRSALCRELAARVFELTGQRVVLDAIAHDRQRRSATVIVDGVCFRLQRRALCVVRACVYCGVGRYASGTIEGRADLGHAVAVWEPRCADCAFDDEDWTHSF